MLWYQYNPYIKLLYRERQSLDCDDLILDTFQTRQIAGQAPKVLQLALAAIQKCLTQLHEDLGPDTK